MLEHYNRVSILIIIQKSVLVKSIYCRTIISYIDKSISDLEKKATGNSSGEESVLEKLLKIDKRVAIIMALDMLMAGVDTVIIYFLIPINYDKFLK